MKLAIAASGPRSLQVVCHSCISPFAGTHLDSMLRRLGTRAVVPRDAVIGYPKEYGEMVLKYTLDGLVTLAGVEDLSRRWQD